MIQNDYQIKNFSNVFTPFVNVLIRQVGKLKTISYGLGSFSYDIRLSSNEFYYFVSSDIHTIDVKNFKPKQFLKEALLYTDETGEYFLLPPNTCGLGVSAELINVPTDSYMVFVGKSTYARVGIYPTITPAEPGWKGYLTIELANLSQNVVKIYANEGIASAMIFKGEKPEITYADRSGKYQDQPNAVVFSKV